LTLTLTVTLSLFHPCGWVAEYMNNKLRQNTQYETSAIKDSDNNNNNTIITIQIQKVN